MKFLPSLILVLLLCFSAFGQDYEEYGTRTMFDNSSAVFFPATLTTDSVQIDTALNLWMVNSQADTNNTFTSRPMEHIGGNDMTISGQIDSLAGTVTTYYYFGYYTSPAYGWTWVVMDSLLTDLDTFKWSVGNQSWATYECFTQWKVRGIEQADGCSAKHSLDVTNFHTQ